MRYRFMGGLWWHGFVVLVMTGALAVVGISQPVLAADGGKPSSPGAADPWNDRVSVDVGSTGRFSVGAFPDPSTGNPTASSFKILYGWPSTGTSFSTLRVDGADAILGSGAPVTVGPTDSGPADTTTFADGPVTVTQTLSLAVSPETGKTDAVRIAYQVVNNDSVSHAIGVRAMLDTDVNDNDGAPFRLPGIGAVTAEQDLSGSSVPDDFQVFQSLADTSHIAAATLRGADATPPDRLVVAAWPRIYSAPWDYTTTSGQQITGDSAYATYWNPQATAPGASRTYVTYYGLADVTVDLTPPIALGLTGPVSLTVAGNSYSPNPFTVVATASDDGTSPVAGASLALILPAGLHTTDPLTVSLGTINPGSLEQQVTWHVTADPQANASTLTYSVTATGSNSPTKTLSRQITIPPAAVSWHVIKDEAAVGKVFGSLTGKKVLESTISHPNSACSSGWQVSTKNNTALVLHTPTTGNVASSRVDFGQTNSTYLFPGQTAQYCVNFTGLNQVFNVLYDVSDTAARVADGAMFILDAFGIPTGDPTALANFISAIAGLPDIPRLATCFGRANPVCAIVAINDFMNSAQSRNAFVQAVWDYARSVGTSLTLKYLQDHLRQKLVSVVTSGWWVTKFTGQVIRSSSGYVAFETVT